MTLQGHQPRQAQENRAGHAQAETLETSGPLKALARPLQCKLAIGAVDDPLERQADQMAERVMQGGLASPPQGAAAGATLRRKCACGASLSSEEECAECGKARSLLQRSAQGSAALSAVPQVAPPVVHEVLNSPGQPLDTATREFFEPRFGHDFSKVRVHADSRAWESTRSVNAFAYASGRDIVFDRGRYDPGSLEGKHLLAHELAHVVQQGEAGAASPVLRRQACEAPKTPCPPDTALTNETSNIQLGTAVHNIVMQTYADQHQSSLGPSEFIFIDRGYGEVYTQTGHGSRSWLATLDPPVHAAFVDRERKDNDNVSRNLSKRPDILDDSEDTLYSIKPCTQEKEAADDLRDYFRRLAGAPTKIPGSANESARRRPRRWQAGTWLPPEMASPSGLSVIIAFSMPQPGVLLYSLWTCRPKEEKTDQPHDQPVIFDRLKDVNDQTDQPGDTDKDIPEDKPDVPDRQPDTPPARPIRRPPPSRMPDRPSISARDVLIVLGVVALIVIFGEAAAILEGLAVIGRGIVALLTLLAGGSLAWGDSGGGGSGDAGSAGGGKDSGGTAGAGGTGEKSGDGKGTDPGAGGGSGKQPVAPGAVKGTVPGDSSTGTSDETVRKLMELIGQLADKNGDKISPEDAEKILALGVEYLKKLQAADPKDPEAVKLKDLAATMLPTVERALRKVRDNQNAGGGGKPANPAQPGKDPKGDPSGDTKSGAGTGGGTQGKSGAAKQDHADGGSGGKENGSGSDKGPGLRTGTIHTKLVAATDAEKSNSPPVQWTVIGFDPDAPLSAGTPVNITLEIRSKGNKYLATASLNFVSQTRNHDGSVTTELVGDSDLKIEDTDIVIDRHITLISTKFKTKK